MRGGIGNDKLYGDAGVDVLLGGTGNDIIYADSSDRVVSGGAGTDTVILSSGNDTIGSSMALSAENVQLGDGDDVYAIALSSPLGISFDLGGIDGTNGFRFDGGAATDEAGASLTGVGDVNGDGLADFVVGAPGVDGHAGEAYLVF